MEKAKKEVYAAVVLAAGQGKRMESSVHKQYLLLHGKPVLYYALKAFEESPVEEIVLVVGKGETDYCQKEIVEKYGFRKIRCITEGGAERYHSVYSGLKVLERADYVLIHDGARPFVDAQIIKRSMEAAKTYQACAAGMPVKDTIKISDEKEFAKDTPDRNSVWMMQTPQAFSYDLIFQAYHILLEAEAADRESGRNQTIPGDSDIRGDLCGREYPNMLSGQKIERLWQNWKQIHVTDDAMVVELLSDVPVRLVQGSYRNMKITTPEDLKIAEALCEEN